MTEVNKIFFSNRVIILCDTLEGAKVVNYDQKIITPTLYQLKDFISNFLTDSSISIALIVLDKSFKEALLNFNMFFKMIYAAGGLVENKNEEYLFIHRLDKWDLPKGKIEKNEAVDSAAIREVEEECGINNPTLQYPLLSTFHIYEHNNQMILKETIWYKMEYLGNEILKPQTEEGITQVVWINKHLLSEVKLNTYPSILEVLLKDEIKKGS